MIHYITTNGIGNPWVAAELEIVARRGVPTVLHSLRDPGKHFFGSAWANELNRGTRLIYPIPWWRIVWSTILAIPLFRSRFAWALVNALFGEREHLRARLVSIYHLFVACDWARSLRGETVSLVHAQWIHSAGTIGMYGAWLLGVPFSFTGHAADLFRDRVALKDKVRRADFIVAISTFHREFYKQLGARDEQLHTVYCGIDVSQFDAAPRPADPRRPTRLLSFGRLVEKKGFDVLIEACRILRDRGLPFDCVIAGSGPLESELKAMVIAANLQGRVAVTGKPLLQEEVQPFLGAGDIFVQPCVWGKDNDVDGTPRTLMEAMACGKPSISTRLVGIPDIIEHGSCGLLVEPNDATQLADAIQALMKDPAEAARLGREGRAQVERKFEIERCVEPLVQLFEAKLHRATADGARGAVDIPRPELIA